MTVTLASIVSGYDAGLASLDHLLSRGADHCAEHRLAENEMLEWKLAPDMFSFRQQAQALCNLAAQWPARLAEIDVPPTIEGATDVAISGGPWPELMEEGPTVSQAVSG